MFKLEDRIIINSDRSISNTITAVVTDYFEIIEYPAFQGSVSGYVSGGSGSSGYTDTIQKFPFAVNSNSSDVANLTVAKSRTSGQSSWVSGYNSGGIGTLGTTNTIEKFPFAADANATDVGDLIESKYGQAGQSSSDNGYVSAGFSSTNVIQKFPFTADANATDVGDLTASRFGVSGQSSTVSGYTSGGGIPFSGLISSNIIDKFPFASDTNASDVGDVTQARSDATGQSSTTHGYISGGYTAPPTSVSPTLYNIIDKFSFASDGNATDVGDLTVSRRGSSGQSSTVSGYTSGGGLLPAPTTSNVIDKFPFASDANSTDVGDIFESVLYVTGQQI